MFEIPFQVLEKSLYSVPERLRDNANKVHDCTHNLACRLGSPPDRLPISLMADRFREGLDLFTGESTEIIQTNWVKCKPLDFEKLAIIKLMVKPVGSWSGWSVWVRDDNDSVIVTTPEPVPGHEPWKKGRNSGPKISRDCRVKVIGDEVWVQAIIRENDV